MSQDLYLNRIRKLYSAQQVGSNAFPSQAETRTKWSKIKNRPLLAWKKTKALQGDFVIHFSNHCCKTYLAQMWMAWLVVLRWDSWYRVLYIIPHKSLHLYSYVKRGTDFITVSIFWGVCNAEDMSKTEQISSVLKYTSVYTNVLIPSTPLEIHRLSSLHLMASNWGLTEHKIGSEFL